MNPLIYQFNFNLSLAQKILSKFLKNSKFTTRIYTTFWSAIHLANHITQHILNLIKYVMTLKQSTHILTACVVW